jgi:small subunit ribosomal protein S21|tara:strand:+ start:1734 stop:1943 length:210 start_codon:yes stop_codon:yes gene_type:complete
LSILVTVRNGNLEQAMRVLKKKVAKEGLVKEIRQRQYYEKPSDKRIRKNKEMAAAWKKKQKKLKAQRGF